MICVSFFCLLSICLFCLNFEMGIKTITKTISGGYFGFGESVGSGNMQTNVTTYIYHYLMLPHPLYIPNQIEMGEYFSGFISYFLSITWNYLGLLQISLK